MTNSTPDSMDSIEAPRVAIGRVFGGRYRVERELGSGGLGTVYVARHETLGRDVAIKVMRAEVATKPENAQRFEREAKALAQLRHPNIVTVLDFGIEEDTSYIVMELAEGRTLDAYLAEGAPSIDVAIEISRQLLRALAHAHEQKIVHRDLKPANLVLSKMTDGSMHLVVLDFGIAKILEEESGPALTQKGTVLGTPAYMAPEQAAGGSGKPTVDVYAAGLVVFEVFTGRRPFTQTDRGALFRAQMTEPPPLPSTIRPELAQLAGFEPFLLRALEKKPSNRFVDAGKMLEALESIATQRTSMGASGTQPALPPISGTFSDSSIPSVPTGGVFLTPNATEASVAPVGRTSAGAAQALDPRWIAGAVALVTFAICGGAYLLHAMTKSTSAPAVPPPTIVLPQVPVTPMGSRANPLDRGVPAELADLARVIAAGGQPNTHALQTIYRYNARNTTDARGLLLLGHTATDRRWYSDATDAYREACEREPGSASDPRLRADLIHFASLDRFDVPANRVLVACVGASAIPEVQDAILRAPTTATKERLATLLSQLRAIH